MNVNRDFLIRKVSAIIRYRILCESSTIKIGLHESECIKYCQQYILR